MSGSSRQSSTLRPIVFGLAAVACLFAVDRVGASVLHWVLLHSDDRMAKIYAGGRADDVLILGSSVGNAMALPGDLAKATGKHVYTMAMHGLDAITQLALVQDYLARNAAPEIALLEIRPARTPRIWAPELQMFAAPGNHIAQVNRERRNSVVPWADIFHLNRFNSHELPKVLQNIVDRDDQETGPSDGRITPAIIKSWQRRVGTVQAAPSDQLEALAATIKAFRDAGTRPIVILAPLHPVALYQAPELLKEVLPFVPPDVAIHDFSAVLTEDRYFEDPLHLNGEGRGAFRPFLAAAIRQALDVRSQASGTTETPGTHRASGASISP